MVWPLSKLPKDIRPQINKPGNSVCLRKIAERFRDYVRLKTQGVEKSHRPITRDIKITPKISPRSHLYDHNHSILSEGQNQHWMSLGRNPSGTGTLSLNVTIKGEDRISEQPPQGQNRRVDIARLIKGIVKNNESTRNKWAKHHKSIYITWNEQNTQ